jgi:hypothetical protein
VSAQSRIGHHAEAVRTLRVMLDEYRFDDFRVWQSLSREHDALDQRANQARDESMYLQRFVATLRQRLR